MPDWAKVFHSEGYQMAFIHHYILATNTTAITADATLSSLHRSGYSAVLINSKDGAIELSVDPNRTTVFVDISDDLFSKTDVEIGAKEMLEDWHTEGKIASQELRMIRRLIIVRHLDHANTGVIQTLIDYLCLISNGRILPDSPKN